MPSPPDSPLLRALARLSEVLSTRDAARRWYERFVETLGARAVVDTCNDGALAWVHRRAEGSEAVLPLPVVHWGFAQVGERLLQALQIHDGRQHVTIRYGEDGLVAESSCDERFPGRLPALARVLAKAKDGLAESVRFVAGLGDESHGPGRVHYPVPVPGGVLSAWRQGLMGCRRALFDGRVEAAAHFLIADGLEGRAVGSGATLEEAEAAYDAEVARALPEQRRTVQTVTDDYDDDGNLIARGEIPPGFDDAPPAEASSAVLPASDEPEEHESWRGGATASPFAPEVDPVTGRIEWGPIVIRGPKPDARPVPRRPECVPHVVLPLDPSPEIALDRGRWVRLLGELGVTRHAVRVEERDGFLLVGSDLLGMADLRSLRSQLDALDALDAAGDAVPLPSDPAHERFVRYRAREYRWSPAQGGRAEGLVPAGGSSGPRFDAGGLDGDLLQAGVRRQRRIRRSAP